jgi:hypothetical protein
MPKFAAKVNAERGVIVAPNTPLIPLTLTIKLVINPLAETNHTFRVF